MKDKFIFEPLPAQVAEGVTSFTKLTKSPRKIQIKSILWFGLPLTIFIFSLSFLKGSNPPKSIAKRFDKPLLKKPVYFNYFDSVVFLNDWQNSKVVVSKGTDEYMRQERLVIKTDNHYFNCYCKDLLTTYAVGDSIP